MADLLKILKESAVDGSSSVKIISTNRLTSVLSGSRGITIIPSNGKEDYEIETLEEFFGGFDKILADDGVYQLRVYPDIALVITAREHDVDVAEYTIKCNMMEMNDLIMEVESYGDKSGGLVVVPPSKIIQRIADKIKIPLRATVTYVDKTGEVKPAAKPVVEKATPPAVNKPKQEPVVVDVKPKGYTSVAIGAIEPTDPETRFNRIMAEVRHHVENVENNEVHDASSTKTLEDIHIGKAPEAEVKAYQDKVFSEGAKALEELSRKLGAAETTEDDFSC